MVHYVNYAADFFHRGLKRSGANPPQKHGEIHCYIYKVCGFCNGFSVMVCL